MTEIVLATLNAKWIHAAFGLRYLLANLGELRSCATLLEFEIKQRPLEIVERILAERPRIVGLGVYIWNARESREVVAALKRVAPEVLVVLGGPEVSHETDAQEIVALADYTVSGEADLEFARLCRELLAGGRPAARVIAAPLPDFAQLAWPYDEYRDDDLARRVLYVEASRGCPFACEFCLSSLDVPVRQAPLAGFLAQVERLLERGALHFKFVDRTFNLNVEHARAILEAFLARLRPGLFLHFELIPDRLPAALRTTLQRFPPGVLQFEVGIQTFDPEVALRISRRQDDARVEANLRWLRDHTGVHVHADLIAGLPGEDVASFARGFDRLVALRPHEIQVGILKRLRGTPIVRHDAEHGMTWSPDPPYEILATRAIPFAAMQQLRRFARFWDLVANSGNFNEALALVLAGGSAFARFAELAQWLHAHAGATHGIALHRLAGLLFAFLLDHGVSREAAGQALALDYRRCARHDWPEFLREFVQPAELRPEARAALPRVARRQQRHA